MKKNKGKEAAEKWLQEELTKLNKELGLSWAFNQEQFDEYVKEQRELGYTGKFVNVPELGNAICRKETIGEWMQRYEKLHDEYKFRLNNCLTLDEYIEEQMSDFECYYTGDYMNDNMVACVKAIFPDVSEEDFKRVYNNTKNKHE